MDIDIDHEEKLDITQPDQIRNSILQLLQPAKQQDFQVECITPTDAQNLMEKNNQCRNVVLIKSAIGGLNIYYNMGPCKLHQNSMLNVIVTKDFSVDVFACVDAMSD
ncbi:MAG: hypothetical protein EZS28_030404 [Streblomastix strix]|uniref:Uncharacterized protein n=1 Tax=Streblomastix strix TaxID=222440 RepID=A0A5J4UUG8_9EUKA|nr:MAG: hypothetical protein EZS28_030404 [Streblomastix strix]